jgi:hypothetical protein
MALNNVKKIDNFGSPVFASEQDVNMMRPTSTEQDYFSVGRRDLV